MQYFSFLFVFLASFSVIIGQTGKNEMYESDTILPQIIKIEKQGILLKNGQKIKIAGINETQKQVIFVIKHVQEDSIGLDPGLSKIGNNQANRLKDILKDANINHIYSILFRRTVLSARPLIKEIAIPIKHFDPGQIEYLTNVYFKTNKENSLVIGTDSAVRDLMNLISSSKEYKLFPLDRYNMIYIIELVEGKEPFIHWLQY